MYLRQQTRGTCINNLKVSKARLAPNYEISIPRLELLAALIGIRCIKFVERIKTENSTETYLARFTMCTKVDWQ